MKKFSFLPLTKPRLKDFEALFGPQGACAGCWCLWCRLPKAEFAAVRGAKAKRKMKARATASPAPGLLAYRQGRAIGWCAVGPRSEFRRLENSRLFKPLDDLPVWSAPCLFIAKDQRGQGVGSGLLAAAARYAKSQGAPALEGYPVDAGGKRQPDAFLWWGTVAAFKKAGFRVAARPSAQRAVMRIEFKPASPATNVP